MSIALGPLGRNGEAIGALNTSGKVAAMYELSFIYANIISDGHAYAGIATARPEVYLAVSLWKALSLSNAKTRMR